LRCEDRWFHSSAIKGDPGISEISLLADMRLACQIDANARHDTGSMILLLKIFWDD
jgi:hypothetical protein